MAVCLEAAAERTRNAVAENERLREICLAEKAIIEDIEARKPVTDNSFVDESLARINDATASAANYLHSLIRFQMRSKKHDVSEILRGFFTQVQDELYTLCLYVAKSGMLDVPITSVLATDERIAEKMEQEVHLFETDEQKTLRMAQRAAHVENIMRFLRDLQSKACNE